MKHAIRNFCIIAHIDHGKSTLADRMLEITETVTKREMKAQLLDSMDLERERGITIKLQPVRMLYKNNTLNLIDTPGHVDFSYEVSRSLAAVEGAVLLVDASQGIQAQTLANLYLAVEQNLTIIPVLNKIDLPNADVEKVRNEVVKVLGCAPEEVLLASGKTGAGVVEILDAVVRLIPAPKPKDSMHTRALIFDSLFDSYKGVVAEVRVMDGIIRKGDALTLLGTRAKGEALEVGIYTPKMKPIDALEEGMIGYVITGLRDVTECRVGDTLTQSAQVKETQALAGYREVKPMVFAGIFPREGNNFAELRESMEKLKLNDAALAYEPEHSKALGYGFRCGFLGLLHLEIVQERLLREYGMEVMITVPSVGYNVTLTNGDLLTIKSPLDLPDAVRIAKIEEPLMTVAIVVPSGYLGGIMNLCAEKRGVLHHTEYIDETLVVLHYTLPLTSLITDFYDKLKSVSSGYASLNYDFKGYQEVEVVRIDILVAEEPVEALAVIAYRDEAHETGKRIVHILKDKIPRTQFVIKLQAAIGGKIIAGERISALRKDVTAKLYGGDVTRKRKLLEKQKKGKAKMRQYGNVEIPQSAFIAALKMGDE